eukprot:1775359-Pleurochrysis_carterae.AAC.2
MWACLTCVTRQEAQLQAIMQQDRNSSEMVTRPYGLDMGGSPSLRGVAGRGRPRRHHALQRSL